MLIWLAYFTLFVLFVFVPIVLFIMGPVGANTESDTNINTEELVFDDEVTVEDMVLHDMINNDDTYDIGVIDFND